MQSTQAPLQAWPMYRVEHNRTEGACRVRRLLSRPGPCTESNITVQRVHAEYAGSSPCLAHVQSRTQPYRGCMQSTQAPLHAWPMYRVEHNRTEGACRVPRLLSMPGPCTESNTTVQRVHAEYPGSSPCLAHVQSRTQPYRG